MGKKDIEIVELLFAEATDMDIWTYVCQDVEDMSP